MKELENIEKEYRLKSRIYEEQENDLIRQRKKGIATLEEVQVRSRYYLKDFVPDSELLTRGLHQIEQMKEEVLEIERVERQKIVRKIEDLDEYYYSQLKKWLK